MSQAILLLVFGVAVGLLSGLLGIGGGIVLVPGLILLFGFTQPQAQGTSLAVLIPPIGIFAALVYYQHGYVRLPVVGWLALGFAIGAFFGAHLVEHLPLWVLRFLFGTLLLYLGFVFVLNPAGVPRSAALPAGLTVVTVTVFTILRRRRPPPTQPWEPPSDRLEYHI
ncbi:MAG: sulfite exporter TauE/SafE family protein [Planctomycetia bacterium]|nr:sulfite exporter TauE/SafE family protein [Planctomycetia bacterium]